MDFNNHVSLRVALRFAKIGYDLYSDIQYAKHGNEYIQSHLNIEECALLEYKFGEKLIYVPTINKGLEYIRKKGWILNVLYNKDLNSYYFTVQNKLTGYEYKQPSCPNADNEEDMYNWGFEHILNRFDDETE